MKGIVICTDSDELKKHTLEAALSACDEIHNMQVLTIDEFCNKQIAFAINTIHYQEKFEIDRNIFNDNNKYPDYGWYRKFEKRKF